MFLKKSMRISGYRKYLCIVVFFSFLSCFGQTENKTSRPTVAVVLSGGGAKGAAHVGALKVIEKAGIPVDIVVGTSMGAIVGGLYSVGYTPESIDSIFKAQDWTVLLSDGKHSYEESYLARERRDNYVLNVPIKLSKKDSISTSNPGIIEGSNVMYMLQKLTKPYHGDIKFDSLRNRFACVAVDLASGKECVFRCGSLDTAIRSSMSIPGVFKPIRKDSLLLVDGGLLNNYPVDVARAMGADIVIGVDLGEGVLKVDKIKSLIDIVSQISGMSEYPKRKANKQNTDIYIKVNVSGYTAASFTKNAIDTLIIRGEAAAMEKFDSLKSLGDELGGNAAYMEDRLSNFRALSDEVGLYRKNDYVFEPFPTDAVSFSANFNQDEMASLIMQSYIHVPVFRVPSQVGATVRLGKRYRFKLDWATMYAKGYYAGFNYEVGYNDIKLNKDGHTSINTTFSNNLLTFYLSKSWRFAKIEGGARFLNYNYKDALVDTDDDNMKYAEKMSGSHNFYKYYVKVGANTTDRKIFPTKGVNLDAEGFIYNGKHVAGDNGYNVMGFKFFATSYLSMTRNICVIPSVYTRYMNKKSYIYGVYNTYGGEWEGYYLSSQMPFYGLRGHEWADRALTIAAIKARLRIGNKHYLYGIFNAGFEGDGYDDAIKFQPFKYGGALKYSYDSFIGPLSVTISSSNVSEKVNMFLSFGFIF